MNIRLNFQQKGQQAMYAMFALGKHLSKSTIDHSLLDLVYFRVSQINGCAFCLDMDSKDLIAKGEDPQRLFVLDAWKEAPFYSDKERAALAYAEALTKIPNGQVSDEIYHEAAKHFPEPEMIDLTIAIVSINGWNRINIAFGAETGTYQVGQYA